MLCRAVLTHPHLPACLSLNLNIQVCPANWKPGDKTIVADPEKSLEYFEQANKVCKRVGATVFTVINIWVLVCVHQLGCQPVVQT